jgi:hypothetical protein
MHIKLQYAGAIIYCHLLFMCYFILTLYSQCTILYVFIIGYYYYYYFICLIRLSKNQYILFSSS